MDIALKFAAEGQVNTDTNSFFLEARMSHRFFCRPLLALAALLAVAASAAAADPITTQSFGATAEGTPVNQFTLTNSKGATLRAMEYGATLMSLSVPDKDGKFGDVVLGYDTLREYELSVPSMGNVVGRYANRIAGGTFTLDGNTCYVTQNNGMNTLHGGFKGIGKRTWKGDAGMTGEGPTVRFSLLDPDGAEGFPGNVRFTVLYTLTDDNTLKVQFFATTDKPTPINLSQHAYFNLSGTGKGEVLPYIVKASASRYLPVDATLIPTGKIDPVAGTPFDFTKPKTIGQDIKPLPGTPPGYDHTLVLDNARGALAKAMEVYDPASGRAVECWTTEPAVHFSCARNLSKLPGKNGGIYQPYQGFVLETQHFSDSPNQPDFPSTILRPGQTYHQLTIYKFTNPGKPPE
jgi:aldose 1-epimerase